MWWAHQLRSRLTHQLPPRMVSDLRPSAPEAPNGHLSGLYPWAWWLGLAAAYFAAGKLGEVLAHGAPGVSPVWPCTGLAMAALLVKGYRLWPGVFLGAFLAELTAHPAPDLWLSGGAALGIAVGNTLEALFGAWFANRFARGREAFWHPGSILVFVLLSAVASTAISASLTTLICIAAGLERGRDAADLWSAWWLADVVSAIVLTPLIVVWASRRPAKLHWKRGLEGVVLLLLLLVTCHLAFEKWLPAQTRGSPLTFTAIPLLLWGSLRFGLRGATLLSFVVACFATAGTLHGYGLFVTGSHLTSLLLLQNFIGVTTVMSLVLAADVVQRQKIDAGLRASELRYRDLFEHNPQPMWVFACDNLRFLAVNEAAVHSYGYSRSEFLGMTLSDLLPPEDASKFREALAQAEQCQRLPPRWRHRKKDGALLEVELLLNSIVFDGRPAVIVLGTDITERLEAERRTAVFSELGRRLAAASSTREAAGIMASAADKLFGWDACCLDLRSVDHQTVHTIFCADTIDGKRTELHPVQAKVGPLARRTFEGGPQLISRSGLAEPFAPEEAPFGDVARRSACMMFVPVRKEARALGVFSIHSYSPQAYTPGDLRTLEAVADLCAGALERIRAEQEIQRLNRELRHHLEELQTIFNVAPVGIAVSRDPQCRVVTGNPACAALLGLSGRAAERLQDASDSWSRKMLRHGQPVSPSELPMQSAARLGRPIYGEELEIVLKDGQVLNSFVSASPLYDESGRVRGSLGIFVDITPQKQAEAALRERDERLRLALAASRMGTWTLEFGPQPRLISSPELEAIFGLAPGEFAGTLPALLELVHPDDHALIQQAIDKAVAQDGDYEIELRFLPRDRPPGWLLVRGRAYGSPGKRERLAGVGIDITAQKRAELEVVRLNSELERRVTDRTAQLEAANKELEAFSYSVSHDLRAPLRSIRGFSDVLLQRYADALDPRGQELLRRSCESSLYMDKLIEDLLNLSRVGRAELQHVTVDLSSLAESVSAELRQAEPARSVEFRSAPALSVKGDERLLRIALVNLLRNAWKFTARQPKARVEFGYIREPQPAFFVRDNGAGFNMRYVGRLFGVFQRLHSAADFPGTGVGLAIVQRIVNRHGGRVWAEGAVDQGATFYFSLPADEKF